MNMSDNNKNTTISYCIVPGCRSNSRKTPAKTFIMFPKLNQQLRKMWFEVIGLEYEKFSKSTGLFVCEDHFDLENDMENYARWKLMGGYKLMKKHVVPHKFDCRTKRKSNDSEPLDPKRIQTQLIGEEFAADAQIPLCIKDCEDTAELSEEPERCSVSCAQENIMPNSPYPEVEFVNVVEEIVKLCAAFGCSNRSNREKNRQFFDFPQVRDNRGRYLLEGIRRRELWIKALRRADFTYEKARYASICSDHFLTGKPAAPGDTLHPDYVPTQRLGYMFTTQFLLRTIRIQKKSRKILLERIEEKSEACLDLIYSDHNYCQSLPVDFVAVNVDQFEVSYEEFNTAGPSGVNFNKFKTEDDPLGLPSTSTNAEYKDDSVNAVIVKREIDDFNDIATENIIIDSPECFVSSCMDFNEYGVGDGFVKCEIDDFTDFPVEVKSENPLEIFYNKITTEENELRQFCTQVHPEHKTETICDTRIKVEIEDEDVVIKSEIDDRCS